MLHTVCEKRGAACVTRTRDPIITKAGEAVPENEATSAAYAQFCGQKRCEPKHPPNCADASGRPRPT